MMSECEYEKSKENRHEVHRLSLRSGAWFSLKRSWRSVTVEFPKQRCPYRTVFGKGTVNGTVRRAERIVAAVLYEKAPFVYRLAKRERLWRFTFLVLGILVGSGGTVCGFLLFF